MPNNRLFSWEPTIDEADTVICRRCDHCERYGCLYFNDFRDRQFICIGNGSRSTDRLPFIGSKRTPVYTGDRRYGSGKKSAKLFSLNALIMMIAPSITPTIGTFILTISGWRWIFYFLVIIALAVIGVVMVFIPARTAWLSGVSHLCGIELYLALWERHLYNIWWPCLKRLTDQK